MKTMSDTPLPRPRMKKAKNISHEIRIQILTIWEMNTYENKNKAYQVQSIVLPRQN